MDLWTSLQTLLGGDNSSAKTKTASGTGASRRHEEALTQKIAKLKEQLDAANARIAELESQLSQVEEERAKLEQNFDTDNEDANLQNDGVAVQIQEMMQSLDEKLQQMEMKTDRQIRQLAENTERQISQLKGSAEQMDRIEVAVQKVAEQTESAAPAEAIQTVSEQMNERADSLKAEIAEKIHTEDVKCYRNIKSLMTDLEVKMEQIELGDESLKKIRKSFKGMKFFSFFALADFAALVFFILYFMGYISIP